jgi:hypothetical protein
VDSGIQYLASAAAALCSIVAALCKGFREEFYAIRTDRGLSV